MSSPSLLPLYHEQSPKSSARGKSRLKETHLLAILIMTFLFAWGGLISYLPEVDRTDASFQDAYRKFDHRDHQRRETDSGTLDGPIGGTRSPKQVEGNDDVEVANIDSNNDNRLPHQPEDNKIVHPADIDDKKDDARNPDDGIDDGIVNRDNGENPNNGGNRDDGMRNPDDGIGNRDTGVGNQDNGVSPEDAQKYENNENNDGENKVGGADIEKREKVKEV